MGLEPTHEKSGRLVDDSAVLAARSNQVGFGDRQGAQTEPQGTRWLGPSAGSINPAAVPTSASRLVVAAQRIIRPPGGGLDCRGLLTAAAHDLRCVVMGPGCSFPALGADARFRFTGFAKVRDASVSAKRLTGSREHAYRCTYHITTHGRRRRSRERRLPYTTRQSHLITRVCGGGGRA